MITHRVPFRQLTDDALVAELRRYADQSREYSPAAADQYDALADRVAYLRRIADMAAGQRDQALADVEKVQANIDAVNRAIMKRKGSR